MTDQRALQEKYWKQDQKHRRSHDHPVVSAAFQPLASWMASLVEVPAGASVLDVGCGNGYLTSRLAGRFKTVVGLDASEAMLKYNPCGGKVLGFSTALPFRSKSFDIVSSSHLLHHLVEADRRATLSEMARVAKKAVVCFEPNRNNPLNFVFSLASPSERMAIRFTRGYLRKLLLDAGLRACSVHAQGWIVPRKAPAWWIPVGRRLDATLLRRSGFDLCAVGRPAE